MASDTVALGARQALAKLTRSRAAEVVEILETNGKTDYVELENIPKPREFVKYREVGVPVVVRGALKTHVFVAQWRDEAKVSALAKEEEETSPSRKYTVYRPEEDGCLNQSDKMQEYSCSFAKFLHIAKKSATSLYLLGVPDVKGKAGASPLERLPSEVDAPVFTRDLDEKFFFYEYYKEATRVRRNVFFNSGYCYTNLHFDTDANAYLCASGRRRWTLCHPDQSRFLTCDKVHANKSTLRPTTGDFGKSPLAALVKFLAIDLEPGDLLLVPSGWWHVVEGGVGAEPGSFSCGVNWFFEMPYQDRAVRSAAVLSQHGTFPDLTQSELERRLQWLVDLEIGDEDRRQNLYAAIAEVGKRYPQASSRSKRRKYR